MFVKFYFWNGDNTTIAYDNVIHLKMNYSVNEYMGGNEFGQPNQEGLLQTLELNQTLLQGVAKAMKSSYAVNGIIKYNTLMDDGKTEQALAELVEDPERYAALSRAVSPFGDGRASERIANILEEMLGND